ncbi:MAG TPA: BON domain-containing protein [Tepidisphaeraceae bacterium]|jgi:osmotically-inducible protein OsmY|nr:BON domain-containing protein [Tepidisphaeraceae bacterium]
MKPILFLLICGLGLASCDQNNDSSQTSSPTAPAASANDVAPDNTAINSRDRAPGAITAGMQGQGETDVQITADIRRHIMDAKMSITAENVKIICRNGKVTLRGPVNNQDEKDAIGRMADNVAGADNVNNELDIK